MIDVALGTIGGPLRSSSATAYLEPALSNYSNLDLVYNSQVTRLIQNGEIDGLPVFTTVEFAKNPTGTLRICVSFRL